MLYLCTRTKADFQNKEEAFAINHKSYQLKILIYVYKCDSKHLKLVTTEGPWFFDRHPTSSRQLLVRFSLGSRQVLVRLSLLIRQSIEDRSRTERGLNEFRTKEGRKKNEKMTENHRRLDGKLSSLMGVPPFCFSSFSLSQMSRMKARFNSAMARKRRMQSTVFG